MSDGGSEIQPGQLPFMGQSQISEAQNPLHMDSISEEGPYHETRNRVLADFERRYLTSLLNRASGNMSRAARMAGVDRTTLYRLMERQGMQRETIMVDSGV